MPASAMQLDLEALTRTYWSSGRGLAALEEDRLARPAFRAMAVYAAFRC